MKHKIPTPITDENFNIAWNYANQKLVELKKKKIIRKILVLIANITFFACTTTLLLSLLAQLSSTTINSFIDTLGPLKTLVAIAKPILSHPDLHIIVQILIYLAFLFVPAFLACGIVTLIVWLVYRPASPNTSTGDKAADSKTLVDALLEIQIRQKRVTSISSMTFVGLFVIELLALSLSLVLFATSHPEILANDAAISVLLEALISVPALASILPSLINAVPVIFIIIYIIYAALNECLSSMLKPLYKTKLEATIQQDAKKYYYECNPEIKKKYEEEEYILYRANKITRKRKKEEAELMAKINYKNPIYKYVKIGIVTLVLIVGLIFAGNKLKSLDLEKFLNELGIEAIEGTTESTETEISTEVNHE